MDGTLIEGESWTAFHAWLGTLEQGRRYAELYFSGRISYEEWAELDAGLWAGLPLSSLKRLAERFRLVRGAREVFEALRAAGIKTALLSCGIGLVVRRVAEELGADAYLANELIVDERGRLTGQVIVNVSLRGKLKALKRLLSQLGARPGECFAVGDDESMVPVFRAVGLGIAFNPRGPEVARAAHVVVRGPDLRAILPYVL